MSEKKRRSVTLSQANYEFLQEQDNGSAVVDRLLTQYREGGLETQAIKRYKLEEVRTEARELEQRAALKRELIDELSASVQTVEERRQEVVAKAVEEMGIPPSAGHDHAAARNWAEKANLPVEEFWSRYTEAYNE